MRLAPAPPGSDAAPRKRDLGVLASGAAGTAVELVEAEKVAPPEGTEDDVGGGPIERAFDRNVPSACLRISEGYFSVAVAPN